MKLEVLEGKITNYQKKVDYAVFMFNDRDEATFGAVAIALSLPLL